MSVKLVGLVSIVLQAQENHCSVLLVITALLVLKTSCSSPVPMEPTVILTMALKLQVYGYKANAKNALLVTIANHSQLFLSNVLWEPIMIRLMYSLRKAQLKFQLVAPLSSANHANLVTNVQ